MKKSVAKDYAKIARMLASRIDIDTIGAECTTGEAEITYKNFIYHAEYELRREFNTSHHDYDTKPDNRSKTYLSIIGGAVYDSEGNEVTSDFDFTAVEEYFDFTDSFEFE